MKVEKHRAGARADCKLRSGGKSGEKKKSELHLEAGAFAEGAFHRQAPACAVAEFLDDGESESEAAVFAAVRFVHGEESREHFVEVFLGYADPRILDFGAGVEKTAAKATVNPIANRIAAVSENFKCFPIKLIIFLQSLL